MAKLINGKQLAIMEAKNQSCDLSIVLATVDAETEFTNIPGDSGNACGYGQVWPQWHRYAFDYAGKRLGISVPSDLAGIRQLTLSNDHFSMIVAVNVIKGMWLASGKNWHKFTLSYVGSGIPQNDYNRRKKIWDKYNNGSTESNESIGITGQLTTNSISGNNTQFDVNVPQTNYGVVEGSGISKDIQYGRKYRVLISNAMGTALDVSQLRCAFSVSKTMQMQPNMSEVTIYNLNALTENILIREGNRIIIEAGYEGEQYGKIFDGDVIQPLRDKEDNVTYKLTLTSLDGDRFLNNGFVNTTLIKGQTARTVVEGVMNKATNPAQYGSISENLSESQLTRGKAVFGLTKDYFRQLAQSQNATFYVEDGKVNIIKVNDLPKGEIVDLSPTSGLIGVPAQNEMGVSAKCLLNPKITTNTFVRIDNSLIRARRIDPTFSNGTTPSTQVVRNLDNDGIYRVIKVTHRGDTRGNDWYTEFEAISQAGLLPSIATGSTANIW